MLTLIANHTVRMIFRNNHPSTHTDNGKRMKYLVVKAHKNEFSNPINFKKGALLTIGEKYEGSEDWADWYFCTTPGQEGGWVPEQLFERLDGATGLAVEDYTAFELDVDAGEMLTGVKTLNGWVWCRHLSGNGEGWLPLENLQSIKE